MKFPDKVTFRFISRNSKKTAKNIAVDLVLYAKRKNDYYVGPKISNKKGEVVFTKQDCLDEIVRSQEMFIMDYSSNLQDCQPRVSIRVPSLEKVQLGIKTSRKFARVSKNYAYYSEEFLKALEKVDNALYVPKSYDFNESDLWSGKVLEVPIECIDK